jgi:hypothetical protein
MAGDFDARIKLLYPADLGLLFTLDDVANGASFDVRADVEIGPDLNAVVDSFELRVGIVNLTTSASVATVNDSGALTASAAPFLEQRAVNIPAGWTAAVGDVLQAVASYKVIAGVHTDFSTAESVTFVVS